MIDVKFKYQNKKDVIQFEAKEKIIEACKTFLTNINTDIETKIIIFNGQENIPQDSNITFEEEMNALNLKGDKCKIMFFDDSAKKEGYNVVVNMGGGPKMVARAKKGEKLKNFFQRLNLNVTNMFFLKNANIVDPEQKISILANKQDKEDKSLQVVWIQNNENNDDENNPNENNNEEDND